MTDTTEIRMEAEKLKNLGNTEYLAERFSSAVAYYTQAISLNSEEPKYYQNRAAAYFGLAQYDSSLADCERALALDRTFLKAVVRGAKCLAKLGRVDEAVARLLSVSLEDPLVEAVRLKTEGNAAWKAEEYEAAAELYTQALHVLGDVDADERAKILCNRAGSYHKLGRFEEALADATAAVAMDSSFAKAHLRRAVALEGLGRSDEAGEEYGWLDPERGRGDDERYRKAARLFNRGVNFFEHSRFREAIECFEQCLPVYQALGRHVQVGRAYGFLGNAYRLLGQFQKAIGYFEKHLAIAREMGDRADEGRAYGNLGGAYQSLCQYQKAIEFHEKHLAIAREVGDRAGEGSAYGNLGNAYRSLGQYHEAIDYYEKCCASFREVHDRAGEGMVYGNLGNAYQALGQYQKAIAYHEKHLAIARKVGDRAGEGAAYGNLGNTYRSLGQCQRAIEYLEMRLAIAREVGDRAGEGKAYGILGRAYNSLGQYPRAIEYHKKYLTIAMEVGDRAGEGGAYGSLGNTYHLLGRYQKAIECHKKHLAIAVGIGDRAGEGVACGNLGNAYYSLGQFQKAIDCYEKHLAIARGICDRVGEAEAYGNLGNANLSLGQRQRAIEYYEKSLAIAREVGDRTGEGTAYGNLGNVYDSLGQFQKAIEFYEKHLAVAKELRARDGVSMALHNMGHTHLIHGTYDRAINLLSQAMRFRESLWDDLGTDETSKITLLESLGKTYRALQQAQIRAGHHESALETAERGRARTLVDRLSRSDATFPSEPLTASAMRSLAESCGTVVVVYSVVKEDKPQPPGTVFAGYDECVYTWVITPDAITFDRRLPARPLEGMAADVANVIHPFKYESSPTSVLTELYDLLIRPIVDLSDVDVITFVPQGPLLFVPFTALHDSETNLDLIDRCVVSISPCVAVLNRALTAPDPAQPRGLAVGNPLPLTGMYELSSAAAAATIIGRILDLPESSVLVEEAATKQAVLAHLDPSPRHVVFLCHGNAPETDVGLARDEDEATLLLSGSVSKERAEGRALHRLSEREMASLDLRSTSVVDLSACELAHGRGSVEGALNLARACIVAGAQSVIASLASVYELPTTLMMIRFYQLLSEKENAACSLREAQRWLRSATLGEIREFVGTLEPRESGEVLRDALDRWVEGHHRPTAAVAAIEDEDQAADSLSVDDVPFDAPMFWAPFQVMGRDV